MKKLVLAEKPSVAREIARVMGAPMRNAGYLEGPEYVVTWALGHLVELAPPADYNPDWKRWSMGSLPMLPEPLKQVVIEDSKDQFKVVKGLMARPDIGLLIIATDAGREGELVARWIMKMAGYKGPAKRLWISSQTDQAIHEGFANLQDASLYDNLYHAAECRAAADWYVGMNVTRALTCHYDAKLSAGRVQTPTLALMTRREDERDAFNGSFYYTLKAGFTTFSATWTDAEGNTHITSEEQVKALEEKLKDKEGTVLSVTKTHMSEKPPLAYDLTALQQDANLTLGFSAKQTLDVLQRLYEVYKIATYPRTDSRYITHDVVSTIPDRLKALSMTPFAAKANSYLLDGFRLDEERFVKDMGVTDHHAILPTEQKVDLAVLKPEEKGLWTLIAKRFLEVLSPDYEYDVIVAKIQVEGELFQARFTQSTRQGWKEIAKSLGETDPLADLDSLEFGVASLKEGDVVQVSHIRTRRTATPAPARYTDATLLAAMEHAGRFVDDEEAKKHLGGGLGTPATRADMIEKLVQYHYVDRVGKEFVPTPKGREVVRLAPLELRSPELTGKWEERLTAIANGKEDPQQFVRDIKRNARELVDQIAVARDSYHPVFAESKECPYCHGEMMPFTDELGRKHFVCQRLSCGYEEMVVRHRILVPSPESSTVPAAPARKVVVVRKAPVAASASPTKKVVVLRKKPVLADSAPAVHGHYEYREEIEVVHPSKKVRRDREDRPSWHAPAGDTHMVREHEKPSGGATFADLIRASQERNNKRRK